MGRTEDPKCECGEMQNSAHITVCRELGDGKGRKWEPIWEDPEKYTAVVDLLDR